MHLPSVFRLMATATLVVCQSSNNTTGKLGDARPVHNNPVIGEVWMAKFDSPTVKGFVTAIANTVGVNYTIDVTGLPVEQGPFTLNVINLGYIGNRGIVFHDASSAWIDCATLQKAE
ncbi:hypothetical protein B0T13DRAFT_451503 [Neurospora crassa]|nr:hypothetical protein B0T13DRAFT_451503 [Neurospora crassa]